MTDSSAPPPDAAPGASALMPTTDVLGLPVTTPQSHAHAHQRLGEINRTPALRELMLRGDPALKAEVEQLGRTLRTFTKVEIAGQEHIQHADAVTAGFDAYIGVPMSEIYGELGAAIASEQNARSPLPLNEHRQAKANLEMAKHDADFQRRLHAGDVRAKAHWSLLHRQITRPIADEP